jgi:Flp pilus assembly pilin Flp
MTQSRIFKNKRTGATAVEFALISPILFLTVFASIEFVRANILKHTASNATYVATRSVIVPGGSKEVAIAKANEVLAMAGIRDAIIEISPDEITQETSAVTTKISIPMNSNSWGTAFFMKNRSITSETQLMTERAPIIQAAALPSQQPPPPQPQTQPFPQFPTQPFPQSQPQPQPHPQPQPQPQPQPVLL